MLLQIGGLILVGFLWGATNPLIKKGSSDIVKVKAANKFKQFILEVKYVFTNPRCIMPMGLNQLGSVVYFFTLQSSDLSLAVPVANSLTFVFTALSGFALNENAPSKKAFLGIFFVLLGTFLCCYEKYTLAIVTNNIENKTV